jgi:hypothetical protein
MVREPFLEIGPGISDTSQQRCLESWIIDVRKCPISRDRTNYFCCTPRFFIAGLENCNI